VALGVDDRHRQLRDTYDTMIQSAPTSARNILEKYATHYVGVASGVVLEGHARLMPLANLLNDLYEFHAPERSSLAAAPFHVQEHPRLRPFATGAGRIVGELRKANAHHDWKQHYASSERVAQLSRTTLVQACHEVARQLDLLWATDTLIARIAGHFAP
jgi:hypothetical protein